MYHEDCPCGGNQTDALVAGTCQQLCQIYEPEQALCRGTLFPELDKPLAGVRNTCASCATQEHMHDFAAWELRLYLNMNPCDQKALKLYRQYCSKLNGCGYACVKDCGHTGSSYAAPVQPRAKTCCDNDISFARAVRTEKDDGFIRVGTPVREKDVFVRADSACCEEEHDAGRWTWGDEPWPWELGASRRKEG
ncbi:MAG: spore coat protein CotJB [Clostridia bacterium]|nr:spore coat protein CotJB [Clostridia bacterium]